MWEFWDSGVFPVKKWLPLVGPVFFFVICWKYHRKSMLNSSKLLSDAFYESPIMELYNRSINYLSQTIDMIDSCIDRPITSKHFSNVFYESPIMELCKSINKLPVPNNWFDRFLYRSAHHYTIVQDLSYICFICDCKKNYLFPSDKNAKIDTDSTISTNHPLNVTVP